jgi:hypothetical protein
MRSAPPDIGLQPTAGLGKNASPRLKRRGGHEAERTGRGPGRRAQTETVKTFVAQTAEQWRTWLDEHHDSESEVWLIFYKLHTGVRSIAYLDALDEALCFGWVDSLVKRLDESRYARKFTPRKADSRWSTI